MSKAIPDQSTQSKVSMSQFRKDLKDYFALSPALTTPMHKHTPFIVLTEPIQLCKSAKELVDTYPPETEVIAQWTGQWRSDFFYFRVQDIIDYWNK